LGLRMAPPHVYLGLGSNLGDRERALEEGVRALGRRGFRVMSRSALYHTEPVGGPPQGWFLNAVIGGETAMSPEALLAQCLEVELQLGRIRGARNGPRVLDIDLLLFGDEVRETATLTLPHPRLHERLFVLIPLSEIAPHARHPRLQLSAEQMRARCVDSAQVVRYSAPATEA